MRIGEVAEMSGLSVRSIRFYESIGLLEAPPRRANGYRDYGTAEVSAVRFVSRARALGFSIEAMTDLTNLYRDGRIDCTAVRDRTVELVADAESRLIELVQMIEKLKQLVATCPGGYGKECPILGDLSQAGDSSSAKREPCCD